MSYAVGGRSVIVTGGSRGIGYGIAEVFAEAGARVTIVGRDYEVASDAAARLGDRGADVGYVVADISKPSECVRMSDEVMAARGGIDVLCANAGIFTERKLADMTEEEYNETFDLNMKGCLFGVQACAFGTRKLGSWPRRRHVLDNGADDGNPWLDSLWREQSGPARFRPSCGDGTGAAGHHSQRNLAGNDPQPRNAEVGRRP